MALWLKTTDRTRQPNLRLAFEAAGGESEYYRYAALGSAAPGAQLSDQWAQYIFQIDDLPADSGGVRLRLDLIGAGEVWLDDVQLFDLAFAENERVELGKIITLAGYKLQAGQIADCARILDGYWPQFLLTNVPLVQKSLPIAQRSKVEAAPPDNSGKRPGKLDSIKSYLPRKWK